MNIKHSLLIAVTSLSALTAANAQEKVEVKVTGRALFDAATYSQNDAAKTQDGTMNDGIGIRDMRIGFKAYYVWRQLVLPWRCFLHEQQGLPQGRLPAVQLQQE